MTLAVSRETASVAATRREDAVIVRLAHFSDIHVTAAACSWRWRDWFNKRMSAWLNLRVLGRGRDFRHTDAILTALRAELTQRNFDHVVFSGDATAMGFAEEMCRAAELLGFGTKEELAGLAVPGNHDYCTFAAMRGGDFERCFVPWQGGERIADEVYPFAQRVGPLWLVGVNSATANFWPHDARGRVGSGQLERLEKLLSRLSPGPRILVTHYPVWLASGAPEHRFHGLRDLERLVSVAERGGVALWLHGHRHHPYHHLPSARTSFPVACSGSVTQRGVWSYSEYTIDGPHLRAVRRAFDLESRSFRDEGAFALDLPKPLAV